MNPRREVEIIKRIGKNLRKLRKERDLSLRELAHIADVDHMTIFRIEKGQANPQATMIVVLAEALGVTPADLFEGIK